MARAPRLRLLGPLGLSSLLACASASSGPDAAPRPFIRRADRQMVVAVHWRDAAAGHRQLLGRRLEDRLGATYRVPVRVESSDAPYPGLVPATLRAWAAAGIDDAVVVEARGEEGAALSGEVKVIALATQDVLHALTVRAPTRGSLTEQVAGLADNVYLALSRRWTAPGRAPEMDPLRAANHLYRKRACAHALPLYELALDRAPPQRTDQLRAHAQAEARRRACRRRLDAEARRAADRAAVFGVEVEAEGLGPEVVEALRARLRPSGLWRALAARTDKPARLRLEGRMLRLQIRHDPARAGFPTVEPLEVGARMDLEPLTPLMRALVHLRDLSVEALPPAVGERLAFGGFAIRLEHLDGDALTFEHADLDGEPVLSPTAQLEQEGARMHIHARDPDLLRRRIFILGPLTDQTGRRTEDAGVVDFLTSAG